MMPPSTEPFNLTLAILPSPAFHPHLRLHVLVPSWPSSETSISASGSSSGVSSTINPSQSQRCTLHLLLSFPDALFLDPSELPDVFAASSAGAGAGASNVKWALSPDVIDIERAVHAHPPSAFRESDLSLTIDRTSQEETGAEKGASVSELVTEVELDLPLHARYLQPNQPGYEEVQVLRDIQGGWVCPGDPPSHSILSPISHPPLTLTLPTGHPSHQSFVELGTAAVIWLGWAYLVWQVVRLYARLRGSSRIAEREPVEVRRGGKIRVG